MSNRKYRESRDESGRFTYLDGPIAAVVTGGGVGNAVPRLMPFQRRYDQGDFIGKCK